MRSPRTVALVLILAGLLTSCGASGGDTADDTTTTVAKNRTTTTRDDPSTTTKKTTTTRRNRTTTTGDGPTPSTLARTAEAQTYVDALAATYGEAGNQFFTEAQATCVAGAYLDAVGVDALQAAGISAAGFAEGNGDDFDDKITPTEAMGGQIFDRLAPCGVVLDQLFRDIAGVDEPTEAQDRCFTSILTTDNLRRSFVADYVDQKLDPDPLDALDDCLKAGG